MPNPLPATIDDTAVLLARGSYVADRPLATALFLALKLGRPLFLEGEAGTGKTEIAKVLSDTLGRRLVRLQCYEGLDVASAVYEWNYQRQMLEIRLAEVSGAGSDRESLSQDIFNERFLIRRPLLQALESDAAGPPILLIDELDRTDEPFEAFLLEVLSDFQVTIPELGTIRAEQPPSWSYQQPHPRDPRRAQAPLLLPLGRLPQRERELEILRVRVPGVEQRLSRQIVAFVQDLGAATCSSSPAWPRRSTGPGRSPRSTRSSYPPARQRHAWHVAEVPGRHPEDPGQRGREDPGRGQHAADRGRPREAGRGARAMPQPDPPGAASGRFARNVMHFARALRAAGLPVGPGRVVEALHALEAVGFGRRDDLYWTLHSVFVSRRDQFPLFDQCFHIFWRDPQLLERMMQLLLPQLQGDQPPSEEAEVNRRVAEAMAPERRPGRGGDDDDEEEEPVEVDAVLTYSARELLQAKDFEQMTAEELAQARREIARLRLPIMQVPDPPLRPRPARLAVDLRRTLAATLRGGGHGIDLARKEPRRRHPPLVILCDISGSMSRYSRMLLLFMHTVTNDRDRVHSFLFGTRLTNVTRHLRQRDIDLALAKVGGLVQDWAGGTRIGHCLHEFNRVWSRRVLGQGAVVLLISDGLDRDAGEGLPAEMERLHKSCRRLIWLNPCSATTATPRSRPAPAP
jgi:uncharacterized protein with von Willebrand factor type A (vWA) domain